MAANPSFWQRLFPPASLEHDHGFRAVLEGLARRGLLVLGGLTVGLVSAYVAVNVFVLGMEPAWEYGVPHAVVLWDKSLMVASGLTVALLSRMDISVRRSRMAVVALAILVATASLLDDVANQGAFIAYGYLTLILLAVVGLMPFRPMQTLGLGAAMCLTFFLSLTQAPQFFGWEALPVRADTMVFLGVLTVMLTGVSAVLYGGRFDQYRARAAVEQLNREVAAQAEVLRDQTERLRRIEQMKDRFFANLSHELRTPLTLIVGPLNDHARGKWGTLSGRISRQLESMRRNSLWLLKLISGLLDLSRIEAGSMRLELTSVDLRRSLTGLLQTFAGGAESAGVQLTLQPWKGPICGLFDEDALEKVFSNLLANAIKHTPAGGRIEVSTRVFGGEGDRYAEIVVRDTGRGIPRSDLARVFDRWVSEPLSGTVSPGTGIGLALARELVELHGGTIHADSELGLGSEFTVNLPLVAEGASSRLPSQGERDGDSDGEVIYPGRDVVPREGQGGDGGDEGKSTGRDLEDAEEEPVEDEISADAPTVLVVDDNDDVRAYVGLVLSEYYRVREASDGAAALEALRGDLPVDLVVSDVMMPGLNGFELCRAVRSEEATRHIPVILLSVYAEGQARSRAYREGADDYISKPFDAAELLTRVENLIELRRDLRQHFSQVSGALVQPSSIEVPSADRVFLERVQTVVEDHLGDGNFGVDWLADEVGLSARQLQRRMRRITRQSAAGYIRLMRLKRAGQLLRQQAGTVAEIAYTVGFSDANHFSRVFKRVMGITPTEFASDPQGVDSAGAVSSESGEVTSLDGDEITPR
jgi:signal transduction histidine kinase/CheY-like chemotaxis protein